MIQLPENTPGRSGKSGRKIVGGRTRARCATVHAHRRKRNKGRDKPWMAGLPMPLQGGKK